MLQFDENGNLTPYQSIETTMAEFEKTFVSNFPRSQTRPAIFENYLRYLSDLKALVGGGFFQFLNGSFVTRKLNPADLDVVTFLDFDWIEAHETELRPFKTAGFYPRVDGYFEKTYPENHPFFARYRADLAYWHQIFIRSRFQKPKGFIKLIFEP